MENVILYISGERGVSVLQRLVSSKHRVRSVVVPGPISTNIDYRQICDQYGIVLKVVEDVNSEAYRQSLLSDDLPDIGIICGFPTIFRDQLIPIPKYGTINLHAGKLPEYRGGSPLNWQLINGEKEITISVIQVDSGIDTGPILAEHKFPVSLNDDISDVHKAANNAFPNLVESVLDQMEKDGVDGRPQVIEEGCYWHQRNIADGRISWREATSTQVHDLVRALTKPYPGAFSYLGHRKVVIYKTSLPTKKIMGTPGHVCWVQGDGPFVICRDRGIRLEEYEILGAGSLRLHSGSILHEYPHFA